MNISDPVRSLAGTYIGGGVEREDQDKVEQVLSLSNFSSFETRAKPTAPILQWFHKEKAIPLTFNFSPKQEELLREVFKKWRLSNEICLVDLLGLEIRDQILKICGPLSPSKEKFLKKFSIGMLIAYLQLLRKANLNKIKSSAGFSKEVETFFGKQDYTEKKLREICEELPAEKKSSIDQNNRLSASLKKETKSRIDEWSEKLKCSVNLFLKCFNDPSGFVILTDNNLIYFSGSESLLDPEKNPSSDLSKYREYIYDLYKFSFQERIIAYSGDLIDLQAKEWLLHPTPLTPRQIFAEREKIESRKKIVEQELQFALTRVLTHKNWAELNEVPIVKEKSQAEFVEFLKQNFLICGLTETFLGDVQKILEEEVLPLRFPGYASLQARTGRVYLNLQSLKRLKSRDEGTPVQMFFREKLQKMFQPLYSSLGPYIHEMEEEIPEITFKPVKHLSPAASSQKNELDEPEQPKRQIPVPMGLSSDHLEKSQDLIDTFKKVIQDLPEKRNQFLLELDQFLPNQPIDLPTLQKIAFEELLDVCKVALICRDMDMMKEGERFQEEFPSSLADLVELEGAEFLIEKRIAPLKKESPLPLAHPQALPVPVKKDSPKKEVSEKSVQEEFSLTDRNVRKVLKKLQEAGFAIYRTTGSHHILKKESRGGQVVVPYSTTDLPRGTIKSIQRQALEALFPDKKTG